VNALAQGFAYDFAIAQGGALAVRVAGARVQLRPSGALWLEAEQALVVADLHLEKGSAYAARGQMLPPYDTRETLGRLEAEAAVLAPRILVLLGDSFHDRGSEDRLDGADAARLAALARGRTLIWVVGNHDIDGPRALPGETAAELVLAGLALRHAPEPGTRSGEVCGHLHPAARVRSPSGAVRRRCFATDGERLILPAFGAYAGGLNLRDAAFAELFGRSPLAVVLGRGRVHAIGWRSLAAD
jgi:DNA ligase-associated metallophosphoesterase